MRAVEVGRVLINLDNVTYMSRSVSGHLAICFAGSLVVVVIQNPRVSNELIDMLKDNYVVHKIKCSESDILITEE